MTIWRLENQRFRAEVSPTGGELASLWDKAQEKEWLWQPLPGTWNNSATQLFPVVGRLVHEGLWLGDRYLPLSAHGFLRQQMFSCLKANENQLLLEACATTQTLACWPWQWRIEVSLMLLDDGICFRQSVRNEDTSDFHYSIGWHPGFALPVSTQSGWLVGFEEEGVAGPFFTENRTLSIPEDLPNIARYPLTRNGFRNGAVYFGQASYRKVTVCAPDGARVLTLETGEHEWLALWGIPGVDLLCIEPLAGTTDDPHFGGQIACKRGMRVLRPGEEHTFETRLRFTVDA